MRWSVYGALIMAMLAACSTGNSDHSALSDPNSEWELIFRDEFRGFGPPNPEKWISQEYKRRGNRDGPDGWWDKDFARLDGFGHLEIRVDMVENQNPESDSDPYDYATGMVSTEGKFEPVFGRYEARIKLPRDPGWWMGFWLFSDGVEHVDGSGEDGTEIDIVEAFGWTDNVNFALHWDGYRKAHKSEYKRVFIPGIRSGWHVFALEWTETEYIWFVDGKERWRSSAGGVSKKPEWIKLSGEIGTQSFFTHDKWSNKQDNKRFPDKFLVDWIRVFERKENATDE